MCSNEMFRMVPVLILLGLSACSINRGGADSDGSKLQYLYTGHERRDPTPEELRRFGDYQSGTSGVFLTPKYFLTADHLCKKNDELPIIKMHSNDQRFVALRAVERSSLTGGFDYCILEVSGFDKTSDILLPTAIWSKKDQVQVDSAGGDTLYTLGFPSDNERLSSATFSAGKARGFTLNDGISNFVEFDVDAVQGSSGGPVYRKSDHLLVSIVSGSKNGGGVGTPHANASDSDSWNWGPALYSVWEESAILQQIFPDGKNRYSKSDGTPFVDDMGSLDKDGKRDLLFVKDWRATWVTAHGKKIRLKSKISETRTSNDGANACGAGWRYPTLMELKEADLDGLRSSSGNSEFGSFFANHFDFLTSFWVVAAPDYDLGTFTGAGLSQLKPDHAPQNYKAVALCVEI